MVERKPPERTQALVAPPAESVTVIPDVKIEPSWYRPPRYADKPSKDDPEMENRAERALFGLYIGYEIQAKCGLFPLTESEARSRKSFASMVKKPRTAIHASLHAAADRLIDAQACTHCMARTECTFRRERVS